MTARVGLAALIWVGVAAAQPGIDFAAAEVAIQPVRGNVYMLVSPAGNSTVQVGPDGVLIVDTQLAELSDKILAAIRMLSDQPLRYIVNTHAYPDHVGGNRNLRLAGGTITGGNVAFTIADASLGAAIVAHENVMLAMSRQTPAVPFDSLPTDTFFVPTKDLYFNGEAVRILHQAHALTNGDSIVHFRGSDVISTGDLFVTTTYPVIDEAAGGSLDGIIDALNEIIDIAVPADKQEGGTYVVPGHGRLSDEADVVEYRDMLTIIRERVKDMIDRGQTVRQVQAARPTRDYDGRYGAGTGSQTTEEFVASVYRGLQSPRSEQ
jgi:glyoxylase-like metal-dependent hydrolase (beta-lactamase superfamily II)